MSIRDTVAERLKPYRRVAVWGAGNMGRNAVRRWLPKEKLVAVVDSNPRTSTLEGVPVGTFEAMVGAGADCIVICTQAEREVRDILAARGLTIPHFFIYELFLPADGGEAMSPLQCLAVDVAAFRYFNWIEFVLRKPQIAVNCTFRAVQAVQGIWLLYPLYLVLFALHYLACAAFAIQLPHTTKIGPGLIFAHFGAIVFSERARIGAFFTIYHGCTVGTDNSGQAPVIGNFVNQYSGSHVLGRSRIGNNVQIGANAVVLGLDAPDGCTVVGMPARVICGALKSAEPA